MSWPEALVRLTSLVPPPARRPGRPDWTGVEARLGWRLPDDYRALVETYGCLVEFLVAVLSAEHRCSAFPDDFPSTSLPLSFHPYR